MVSLTKKELEFINNFYTKNGTIEVKNIDKKERLCIVSIPVIDEQKGITNNQKIITVPIDYTYDEEDVDMYNIPKILDDNDIHEMLEYIWQAYQPERNTIAHENQIME